MKLISHRGNVDSRRPDMENQPSYIDQAIASGYDVEVDIWHTPTGWCLGHDGPELTISQMWLHDRADKLWLHCKNFLALQKLLNSGLKVFFHEQEKHTVIANGGAIWSHNLDEAGVLSIIPLITKYEITNWTRKDVYGVCSDYIEILK
jgi:hypothetical protein